MLTLETAAFLAVAVLGFIAYSVLTNNKSVASLSQLGDLQKRADIHDEIKRQREEMAHSASSKDTHARSQLQIELSQGSSVSERISFVIGVLNMGVTMYILGAAPTKFYLWYSPKAVVLIFSRYIDFVSKGTHWLLADFCYWANGLLLLYIWFFPHNDRLFQIVFMCANGPLAWSVLTFNQALVFHKWQQIVSVFIHVSPMLLSFGLRWFKDDSFAICSDWPRCESVTYTSLVFRALTEFYLWWVGIYYMVIFVVLGPYLESRSFKTLFDRVAGSQMKFLFGKDGALGNQHKLIQRAVYMSTHVIFSIFTMLVACIWWSFAWAHISFIIVICTASAYNASIHYDAQFKVDRESGKVK